MTTSTELKEVTAYADGSSLGHGQTTNTRAAAAALLSHRSVVKAFAEYLGSQTNQQAEIRAAILAVRSLTQPCRLRVVTDSRYVVMTMTPGPGQFKRRANLDLWEELDRAIASGGHAVTFEWTKGHAVGAMRNLRQEAADQLARETAAAGRVTDHMLRRAVETFVEGAASAPAGTTPAATVNVTPALTNAGALATA